MKLALLIKDCYRDGKKLRKGPKGRHNIVFDGASVADLAAQCAATLGYEAVFEMLTHPDPAVRPVPVTTVAQVQALSASLDTDAPSPLWCVVRIDRSGEDPSMSPGSSVTGLRPPPSPPTGLLSPFPLSPFALTPPAARDTFRFDVADRLAAERSPSSQSLLHQSPERPGGDPPDARTPPRTPRTPSHVRLQEAARLIGAHDSHPGAKHVPPPRVPSMPWVARAAWLVLALTAVSALTGLGLAAWAAAGVVALQQAAKAGSVATTVATTVATSPATTAVAYGHAGYGNAGRDFSPTGASWLNGGAPLSGVTRSYYVACQEVLWNYAPQLSDVVNGGYIPGPFDPRGPSKLGWAKRRYVEYSDSTYTTPVVQPVWLGILGPILRATVGDVLSVNYFNNCTVDTTMHPHGVKYNHDNSGAWSTHRGAGGDVAAGSSFTYTWYADATSGPVNSGVDTSSVVWWYHSHITEGDEVNQGLLGCLIITGAGQANPDATPIGVDKEFVLLMMVGSENHGGQLGQLYHMNGRAFGNLQGLNMTRGDRVRWYLIGMGDDVDVHTVHWHANTVVFRGYRTDVVELLQGTMAVADMAADNIGNWLFHCHVSSHMAFGMNSFYYINPAPGDPPQPALVPFSPKPGYVYPLARDI